MDTHVSEGETETGLQLIRRQTEETRIHANDCTETQKYTILGSLQTKTEYDSPFPLLILVFVRLFRCRFVFVRACPQLTRVKQRLGG